MREIKFRTWIDRYKEFKYWGFIQGLFIGCPTGSGLSVEECKNLSQQFTGLKDKNGKEIYEGDFIQNVADDGRRLSIFEIRWQQSCCGFVKEREDGRTFTLEISKYFEVVGNIYEHPNLLKNQTV